MVFNEEKNATASMRAAGLYNPITGRKMVKTWWADRLFANIESDYGALEQLLNEKFLHPIRIYRSFNSVEDRNDWEGKAVDPAYVPYLQQFHADGLNEPSVNDPYGGISLNRSGYVDIPTMLNAYKKYLVELGVYESGVFDVKEVTQEEDSAIYKEWAASKVIFCQGPMAQNPHWEQLPFRPVRGEIMDVASNVKLNYIVNQGVFLIPKNGYFTVGSTYDHGVLSFDYQPAGIEELERRLKKVFSADYEVVYKRAGVRPATHDRKPYIGFHPKHKTLGIFNGFGTKGVSLSPYCAKHFADFLDQKCELERDVDVQRVM